MARRHESTGAQREKIPPLPLVNGKPDKRWADNRRMTKGPQNSAASWGPSVQRVRMASGGYSSPSKTATSTQFSPPLLKLVLRHSARVVSIGFTPRPPPTITEAPPPRQSAYLATPSAPARQPRCSRTPRRSDQARPPVPGRGRLSCSRRSPHPWLSLLGSL